MTYEQKTTFVISTQTDLMLYTNEKTLKLSNSKFHINLSIHIRQCVEKCYHDLLNCLTIMKH